ncbi:MAG: redoxin domain-containing protein [Acidobacteria bacterium]|nr:redoxin domain-containing protein [Acidobacteriota bacterium]
MAAWVAVTLLATAGASAAQPSARPSSPVPGVQVADARGPLVDPLGTSVTVFFFVAPDCPISNRYAPEIARLHRQFASEGVALWLVYVEPDVTPAEVARHRAEYGLDLPVLFDAAHELVRAAGAVVTPEAAVFVGRERAYSGRIDDRVVDFGQVRPAPTHRDLSDALAAVLAGRPVAVPRVPGVGCIIGAPPGAAGPPK